MGDLHSRAAACGLVRHTKWGDPWWQFPGNTFAHAWCSHDQWYARTNDQGIGGGLPFPTEDAALLRVVEHLEAKRVEDEGGIPWACDECGKPGRKANGPEGWCEEHWPAPSSSPVAAVSAPAGGNAELATSGEGGGAPDLHVHHTPAAVERWEVCAFERGYAIEPTWEPFAVTPISNGFAVWCRRRLPAGVARG